MIDQLPVDPQRFLRLTLPFQGTCVSETCFTMQGTFGKLLDRFAELVFRCRQVAPRKLDFAQVNQRVSIQVVCGESLAEAFKFPVGLFVVAAQERAFADAKCGES